MRKAAKGISCPARPVADVKGKTGQMTVGGSLGYLKLSEKSCVAVNPKRIELALRSWNKKPTDLSCWVLSVVPSKASYNLRVSEQNVSVMISEFDFDCSLYVKASWVQLTSMRILQYGWQTST